MGNRGVEADRLLRLLRESYRLLRLLKESYRLLRYLKIYKSYYSIYYSISERGVGVLLLTVLLELLPTINDLHSR